MSVRSTFHQLDPRKRKRILSAAISEFATSGYAAASINSIVERVGISKGSIFNYFTDKRGLFLFVFQQALEQVKDYLRRVRDESMAEDLFSRLEKMLLAGVSFIRSHPRIYRIYLRVLFEGNLPDRDSLITSLRELSTDYLTEFLVTAKERGEIDRDLDVNVAAFVIEAVLERFLQAYSLEHLDAGMGLYKAQDDEVKRWAQGIIGLLKNGLVGTEHA